MTTYDAPVNYWSGTTRSVGDVASWEEVEDIKEILALEEGEFQEGSALARFNESHPRFKWFLLVNIFLSAGLVFAGVQIAASHPPLVIKALMQTSGVKTMSANELIQSVKAKGETVYWLNVMTDEVYTNNSSLDGINQISYIHSRGKLTKLAQYDVIVKTFRNIATYGAQLHQMTGEKDTVLPIAKGLTLNYNSNLRDHTIVTFPGRPEVVVLQYPAPQPLSKLISDAERLVPIQ